MNKLKGTLCAFCMIFSAIISDFKASYKDAVIMQSTAIATDIGKFQEDIFNGGYPLVGNAKEDTETNINNFLAELKYSPEDSKKLKNDTFGAVTATDMHDALTTNIQSSFLGQRILPSILEASLNGDIEIPYWSIKEDPKRPFLDVAEADIDTKLTECIVTLSDLVDFAHKLRTFGCTPTEFLKLYSVGCSKLDSERCQTCDVQNKAIKIMQEKLKGYGDMFYVFVNVMRSIENDATYNRIRKNLLYGDAVSKTPVADQANTADAADLFNFLHLFLKEADNTTDIAAIGFETNIVQVAHNWLIKSIDLTVCYPKVVNTLLDMMYIAHVGQNSAAVDAFIDQKKRYILSQAALKMLNQALKTIKVDDNEYRLIGINDLRIEGAVYKVLGLDSSFVDDATSFLLPVAFFQDVNKTDFSTYRGAPLLIASDIVYMVRNKTLPIVSMLTHEDAFFSTCCTGYNLIKQSTVIDGITHDGNYNSVEVKEKYGKVSNKVYRDDWSMESDSLEIAETEASLIVGELFSWYTQILDVSSISSQDTREKYETKFQDLTKNHPTSRAFIVEKATEVKNITGSDKKAYIPNTVYADNTVYENKHYISLESETNKIKITEQDIKGVYLITSLLNSSWGKTMLRASDVELEEFSNITSDTEIDEIGTAGTFNTNEGRVANVSSTVHQLEGFQKALQTISNYTFPGFQPHSYAYGHPLATLKDSTICKFIVEVGSDISDSGLNNNSALCEVLKTYKFEINF